MTISMINDILLSIFLFVVYFSFGAIILNETQSTSQKEQDSTSDDSTAIAKENDSIMEASPPLLVKAPNPENSKVSENLTIIIQQLKQPQLRKLCHPLGIQQKVNGAWISTDSMRKQVQGKIKQQPQTVIQVMNQRLPDIPLNLTQTA